MKGRGWQRDRSFWRLFNTLARIVGWSFVLVGGILAIFGLERALREWTGESGIDAMSPAFASIILEILIPVLVAFAGWLILRALPYNPTGRDGNGR